MAQKTLDETNILNKLSIDKEQEDALRKLDRKRLELEDVNREGISQYEQSIDDILQGKEGANIENLSKIEQALKGNKQFEDEVRGLAESLTRELRDFGQFIGTAEQYQGIIERGLVAVGLKNAADRQVLKRVNKADIRTNLETVLNYGAHMIGRLNEHIINNQESRSKLEATVKNTTLILTENQPIYQNWRSEREKIERELEVVEDNLDQADEKSRPGLEATKAALQSRLSTAQINENVYFTKVDRAQKILPVQRLHLQSYESNVKSLLQMRVGLEADIEGTTQIYLQAPVGMKTALSVKAASQYHKGLAYATEKTTQATLKSSAGISDEAATTAERHLLTPEKIEENRTLLKELQAMYDARMSSLKSDHSDGKSTV